MEKRSITPEEAIAALKKVKENEGLNEKITAELKKLIEADSRPDVKEILKTNSNKTVKDMIMKFEKKFGKDGEKWTTEEWSLFEMIQKISSRSINPDGSIDTTDIDTATELSKNEVSELAKKMKVLFDKKKRA